MNMSKTIPKDLAIPLTEDEYAWALPFLSHPKIHRHGSACFYVGQDRLQDTSPSRQTPVACTVANFTWLRSSTPCPEDRADDMWLEAQKEARITPECDARSQMYLGL